KMMSGALQPRVSRFGVQPSGCADLEQAKACTPCLLRRSARGSGLEFSLQAALRPSRLKPELRTSQSDSVDLLFEVVVELAAYLGARAGHANADRQFADL